MSLKIFTTIILFFSFVFTLVSHADEPVLRKIEKKEFAHESLRQLEKEMRSGVDDTLFPVLFSKYIAGCMDLNEHKRAKDFFLTLAEENRTSPHAMTAKGVVTYGWWAENVLRHGLKKIDEAIALDKKAFFPRLCRATYLSCLPEEFMAAIHEFNALLETERDNTSNLSDVCSNLIRIYGEHGHHDMEEQVNKQLRNSRHHRYKQINYKNTSMESFGNVMYSDKINQSPYPIINNINTKKRSSPKDKHLNGDLALLEKSILDLQTRLPLQGQ